jgi:hypothetical protein
MIHRTLKEKTGTVSSTYVEYPVAQGDNELKGTLVRGTLTVQGDLNAHNQMNVNGALNALSVDADTVVAKTVQTDTVVAQEMVVFLPTSNSSSFGYSVSGTMEPFPFALTSGVNATLGTLTLPAGTFVVNMSMKSVPITDGGTEVKSYSLYVLDGSSVKCEYTIPYIFTGAGYGPYFSFSNSFVHASTSTLNLSLGTRVTFDGSVQLEAATLSVFKLA